MTGDVSTLSVQKSAFRWGVALRQLSKAGGRSRMRSSSTMWRIAKKNNKALAFGTADLVTKTCGLVAVRRQSSHEVLRERQSRHGYEIQT